MDDFDFQLFWDIMKDDFDTAARIFLGQIFGGICHEIALELFKEYIDQYPTHDIERLSQLAVIFADEPNYEATYGNVCSMINRELGAKN